MTRLRHLLTMLLALSLVVPLAAADEDEDEDDDGARRALDKADRGARDDERDDDDDRLDRVKRKVELDVDASKALIKLARESNGSEDEVKILYEGGAFKLDYETENATQESKMELKVRFTEAIEFRDLDGDGAYDAADEIVRRHHVDDLAWRTDGPVPVVSGGGVPGHKITGTGAFREGGALVFVLYAYGDFANVNGTSLRPSEVKIDIILDDFPFSANDTLPALIVKSEQESEIEAEGHEDGVRASVDGIAAYFSWAPNATVDGRDTPVHTTVLKETRKTEREGGESSDKREQRFALSYARGAHVNHDPLLGIQSASEARSVPGPTFLLVVAGVAVLAVAWGRKLRG